MTDFELALALAKKHINENRDTRGMGLLLLEQAVDGMAAAHAEVVAELAETNAAILRTANSLQDGYEYVLSGDDEELKDAGILEAVTITARALADIDKSDSPWPQIAQLTGREITEDAADAE